MIAIEPLEKIKGLLIEFSSIPFASVLIEPGLLSEQLIGLMFHFLFRFFPALLPQKQFML